MPKNIFNEETLEMVKRALDTSVTAIQPEDLERVIAEVTPDEVPLFSRLKRMTHKALTHEWVEHSLAATLSDAVYDENPALPAANSGSYDRKSAKTMAVGRIAKVTGMLNAVDVVGAQNAFALESVEKMKDLMRVVEYFIINGDASNTNPQEMDGLLQLITTNSVSNGNTALDENKLNEAFQKVYEAGGNPSAIVCRPAVAMQIAAFTASKVRFTLDTGEAANSIGGHRVSKYLNPFGGLVDIIVERPAFMATGNVLILDESQIALSSLLTPIIQVEDLAHSDDTMSKLLKAYITLVLRNETHHAVITGVTDSFDFTP